jgi:hypothetical protein
MTAMRYICVAAVLAALILPAQTVCANRQGTASGSRPFKDIYGNSYKKSDNLFRDNDKNGVRNIYQKRDRRQIKKNKLRR